MIFLLFFSSSLYSIQCILWSIVFPPLKKMFNGPGQHWWGSEWDGGSEHLQRILRIRYLLTGIQTTCPYTEAWKENSPRNWSPSMPGTPLVFSCWIFDELYLLQTCLEIFSNPEKLTTHGVRQHGHEKVHQCNDCGQRFAAKQTLYKHMIVHSSERPFT